MQRMANNNKVQISEIFTSVEGEGIYFGTKTMFIRLAGCPLRCHWCDTEYALQMDSGTNFILKDAQARILELLQPNTYKVNFTGGDPLVQHEAVIELAKFVKELGLRTYVESACFDAGRFSKIIPYIDICKIEFKMRDSRAVDSRHFDNLQHNEMECMKMAINKNKITFIKIVITSCTSLQEFQGLVKDIFELVSPGQIAGFIIQPSHVIDEPTVDRLFEFYDVVYPKYNDVRIIPQLHKVIGAR